MRATAKSSWKQGQQCDGVYCGQSFTGKINENTRPTVDGRNVIWCISLDNPITVFGTVRNRIEIWSNGNNGDELYLI